jgi:hypothetical protein
MGARMAPRPRRARHVRRGRAPVCAEGTRVGAAVARGADGAVAPVHRYYLE